MRGPPKGRPRRPAAARPARAAVPPRDSEWIYGCHPIEELLQRDDHGIVALWVLPQADGRLAQLARRAREAGVAVKEVGKAQLRLRVGDRPHQGAVAQLAPFVYAQLEDLGKAAAAPLLVALDQVQDPHNVGSLVRSAYVLGADGLLLPQDRACGVTAAVRKAAAGTTAHLPIARVVNLARALRQLRDRGCTVVGSMPTADTDLSAVDLRGPTVWVVGGEAHGMRPLVQRQCDHLVRIPMRPAQGSLGAAAAGAICLYEAARQRGMGRLTGA